MVVPIITIISIKWKYIYNTHWQASDLPRLFLSARGGSLSVGGVVLRSERPCQGVNHDLNYIYLLRVEPCLIGGFVGLKMAPHKKQIR